MLEEALDDEQRADVYYWLWRIEEQGPEVGNLQDHKDPSESTLRPTDPGIRSSSHDSALSLYRQLYADTPMYEYKKRIEGLSTAPDPVRAAVD